MASEAGADELMAQRWFRSAGPGTEHPYAVNIGSGDGRSFNDPVYPLFADGWNGLAIEWGDPHALHDNLGRFPGVRLLTGTYVTPTNIRRILTEADCPTAPDLLKIDIDGCDADVLTAILRAGYRPRALQVEVNPEVPPPYAFSVVACADFLPGGPTGFFGMSLQYACDAVAPFGYRLAELDFTTPYTHDALFLQAAQGLDPRAAFLAAPVVLPHILGASREEKLAWRTRADRYHVLQEIWIAMNDANQRKHGHGRVPFTLYLAG